MAWSTEIGPTLNRRLKSSGQSKAGVEGRKAGHAGSSPKAGATPPKGGSGATSPAKPKTTTGRTSADGRAAGGASPSLARGGEIPVVSGPERKAQRSTKTPPAPSATTQDPIQFAEELPPPVKSFLNDKQLQEFKELLLEKRAELAGDVQHLTDEALNRTGQGFNEQSTMPIHMADLGSDNWEQDFTLGLIVNEQNVVREIDGALQRIEDGTYGVCLATSARIGVARLRAKPWARYCIEYERRREEGRAP